MFYRIGPLQLEVTWYKIQNIGEQKNVPDQENMRGQRGTLRALVVICHSH